MSEPSPLNECTTRSHDKLESIRDALLAKSADEIERELPNLIDTVRAQSIGTDETIRFIIGVSFTSNQTCFDYWMDRVVLPKDREQYEIRVEKEAIDSEHHYVTFCFPPDPQFNGEVIRGALLTTVEEQIITREQFQEDQSWEIRDLRKAIQAGIRAFRQELP